MNLLMCLSFPFISEVYRTSASFVSAWVEPFSSLPVFPFLSSNVLYPDWDPAQHFNALHCITQTLPCRYNGTARTNKDNHIMTTSHTLWLLSDKLPCQRWGYRWVNIYESQCFQKTAAWEAGKCPGLYNPSAREVSPKSSALPAMGPDRPDFTFPPLQKHGKVFHV